MLSATSHLPMLKLDRILLDETLHQHISPQLHGNRLDIRSPNLCTTETTGHASKFGIGILRLEEDIGEVVASEGGQQ